MVRRRYQFDQRRWCHHRISCRSRLGRLTPHPGTKCLRGCEGGREEDTLSDLPTVRSVGPMLDCIDDIRWAQPKRQTSHPRIPLTASNAVDWKTLSVQDLRKLESATYLQRNADRLPLNDQLRRKRDCVIELSSREGSLSI